MRRAKQIELAYWWERGVTKDEDVDGMRNGDNQTIDRVSQEVRRVSASDRTQLQQQ